MIARIKTGQRSEMHHQVDPACPVVVHFLEELLDDESPYAPAALRLECFETTHIRRCERCERFGRAFAEWLDKNDQEREEARHSALDHAIADQRALLRRLNELD